MSPSVPPNRSLRLLLELGRGGMGVVYLALHQGPGGFTKLKVVKRLRPDLGNEAAAVDMFLEEGRLSARLHHPNVVQTNEVGFDGKHYFLEMEYLEGQTLETLTKRAAARGGLDRPLAVWILAQALAGLHYAHELTDHEGAPLRVVHRDVSPHNIFVTYDGEVKVLDFGIAKAADSQHETQTGVLKGKVTYMSPEQVARKALDRRADVFAAGVILWQILARERLWKDLDDFEIFLKLRSEDIPKPSSVRDDVPEALEAACMRALARSPDERTASAAEMQRELEGWLEGSGARVGAKEVSAGMNALFAKDKAETKSEIEQRIRTTPVSESVVGVPMLRVSPVTGTGTNAITARTLDARDGTRVRQQQQIRGLRGITVGAVGIALIASVAASVSTLRARRARTAAAVADAGAVAALPICTNRACSEAHGGKPWVCRASDHECVAVESEDCKAMYEPGDLTRDDTVWLGAMFPMKGEAGEQWGKMNMDGVDFARSDVARVTESLGASSSQRAKKIAVVGCDDSDDGMRAAKHMVDDVGVPAIIGFQSSKEIVNIASNLLIPSKVLAVASITPNPTITRIPQPSDLPRMVWRTTVNFDSIARATAHFIPDAIEQRYARPGTTTRVALVRDDSASLLAFATTFYRTLVFNGKSALENGHDYTEIPSVFSSIAERLRVADLVASSSPSVVVLVPQGEENILPLVEEIEARIKTGLRPTYVLVNTPTGALKSFIGTSAERRHRVFGVDALSNLLPNARFVIRYNQTRNASVTREENPGVSYDAFYLLAYSVFGLPPETPISGPALALGFRRLMPPGKSLEAGPNDTLEALSVLSTSANVDLQGTQGGLDFDLASGEATWDIAFFCAGADTRGHLTGQDVESGVVYRDGVGRIEGTIHCP